MLPKQLFYVTADMLCAYQWRRGKMSAGRKFTHDKGGLEAFGRYLADYPDTPAYIVADVVEEDFQRVLLPHVGLRSGRELIARRLAQLYRDTPFRHAAIQGRELDGRRDDRVLFSALTNANVVQPWINVLEGAKLPLAAVYSTTFVAALLVKKLQMAQEHLLLITQQSGGLRQSYFQGRHLKFSRLTPTVPDAGVAANIVAETGKMQQFLTSTRLTGRGDVLRVLVIAPADRVAQLEGLCDDGTELAFHFIDMDAAADKLGMDMVPRLADQLLLTLIGKQAPASQYALGPVGRFYRLWQARIALYAGAALTGLAALVWTAANIWGIVSDGQESTRLLAESQTYEARYGKIMATLPPTVSKTANMKAAVQMDRLLAAQGPAPAPLVNLVSLALDHAPSIRLMGLDWQVEQPVQAAGPGAAVGAPSLAASGAATTTPGDAIAPIAATSIGVPVPPSQVLRIEGEIEVPQNEFRSILDIMNTFAQELARQPHLVVEVAEPPVDVRPNVKLSGKAGLAAVEAKPRFVLKVTWKP
ncbi:MAG: hypothetical protein V4463_03040 [Pseudomonadota bacterium]